MDKEPNIFPEFSIVPTLKEVGSWIAEHLQFIPDLGLTHGDHLPHEPEE